MILQKRQLMYLLFLVVASFLLVAPLSLSAQDIEEVSEELAEDTENNKDAKIKKCIKEAKTNKDKKNCAKQINKQYKNLLKMKV